LLLIAQDKAAQSAVAASRAEVYRAQQAAKKAKRRCSGCSASLKLRSVKLVLAKNTTAEKWQRKMLLRAPGRAGGCECRAGAERPAAAGSLSRNKMFRLSICNICRYSADGALGWRQFLVWMLGAGAWYAMYQNQEQARRSAQEYASQIDEVVKSRNNESGTKLENADAGDSIDALMSKLKIGYEISRQRSASIKQYQRIMLNSWREMIPITVG
jgi:hypothetical protein